VEKAFGDSLVSFGRSIVEKNAFKISTVAFYKQSIKRVDNLGYSPEHTNLLSVSIERHLKARIRFRDNMALFPYLVFIMRVRMKPLQLFVLYKMMIVDYTISLLTCGLYHISDQSYVHPSR
jgi:hypothetical protein